MISFFRRGTGKRVSVEKVKLFPCWRRKWARTLEKGCFSGGAGESGKNVTCFLHQVKGKKKRKTHQEKKENGEWCGRGVGVGLAVIGRAEGEAAPEQGRLKKVFSAGGDHFYPCPA